MKSGGPAGARLAVDVGGTFTDVVLEARERLFSVKVLTTPRAPEEAVMEGIANVLAEACLGPHDVAIAIHGTTLATNALIERKGARTAFIATKGHLDTLELGYEDRFSEYDIYIDKPPPLIPRNLRFSVPERMSAWGETLLPLDEAALEPIIAVLDASAIESVAVGFIHAYANPSHEQRVLEILRNELPRLSITLSSEVCPEVREYDRFSTASANAYVQPLMAGYLNRLAELLNLARISCPLYLMLSGGGLATLETAVKYPVRLVESGPAGGAILAASIAAECNLPELVSFDMGGTTAKICLIDDYRPQNTRMFEVGRAYRFLKGSGLPLRIPVIEMVEIGAGGGSIARLDQLRRIAVGPDSASAEPGPACYGRGGRKPTVTDADLVLGKIDPDAFAGGTLQLDANKSERALKLAIAEPLGLETTLAAFGIGEMVGENMANATRVHAIERGRTLSARTLVAFGGAAPLHAARLADKLDIARVIVPASAGVGSAVGFLRAPIAYEMALSRYMRLTQFDAQVANEVLDHMAREVREVVRRGAPEADLIETRHVEMRYVGQGHEISVALPLRRLAPGDRIVLQELFDEQYRRQYARPVAGAPVEILSWVLALRGPAPAPRIVAEPPPAVAPAASTHRSLFDPETARYASVPVYRRDDLAPGTRVSGPAIISEAQTSTIVTARFDAHIDRFGSVVLERRAEVARDQ